MIKLRGRRGLQPSELDKRKVLVIVEEGGKRKVRDDTAELTPVRRKLEQFSHLITMESAKNLFLQSYSLHGTD